MHLAGYRRGTVRGFLARSSWSRTRFPAVAVLAVAGALLVPAVSQAYVHAANCQGALVGGNGDNDIYRHATAWYPGFQTYTFTGGTARYSDSRVAVTYSIVDRNGGWHGFLGYCYSPTNSDGNIYDDAPYPPAGF
jgi:hypothetical protein